MSAEKKKLLQIKEAFDLAQKPHQNHAKLVSALRSTYNKVEDKTIFYEEFVHFLKYPMVVYKRELAVERVMDFVTRFITSFYQPESEDGTEEEDDENSPVNYLFNFLLKSHNANSQAVRFRVCQLINKLLGSLPENAQIDDDLFDKIHDTMLIRLKDKVPNVRIQSVLALARLQDPQDENCPVTNAYLLLLENDSNPEVRRAVLSCIAPSAKTLPQIVGRTMDIKDVVRKLAYQVLSEKIHMRALSIAQRVQLLQQGLNDRSDAVKEVMQKKLLQAWLRFCDGDVLELLHRLDVENCSEVAISALNVMFALSPINELVQNCKNLDDSKLIPVENLTPENVLYWKSLCEYLKSKGEEGETALEQILPEPAVYAEYLLSYLQNLPVLTEEQKTDFTRIEDLMTKEFISQQLILIIGCLDKCEEGGRKRLLAILQESLVLPNTSTSLVPSLTEMLLSILQDNDKLIQIVAEIMSELREPIVSVDIPVDATESRRQQLKVAEIKVQIFEIKQALEDCITLQDFGRASTLKEKLTELENLKNELIKEADKPEIKEMRVEKNDAETLLKCLKMCYELLKAMPLSLGLGATMREIVESLILPGVTNVNPSVRNMAVLCLGCCALQNKDFARQHLALLLQISQIDEVKVKLSALKAVFDQLMLFGLETFKVHKSTTNSDDVSKTNEPSAEEQLSEIKEVEDEITTVNNILHLLSNFLDSEISELRTEAAEGLAKLMFSGRLISSKLLSRLVLLWYNPVTEEDTRLRHCLGVFFPIFAYANRTNQECFEEAFFPTLRTLFNAPASSPLADVDVSNVADLFVDLTRPSGLNPQNKKGEDCKTFTVHDNLALKICNEILKDPAAPDVRIYAKALSSLELTTEDSRKDLLTLLNEIFEKVKDKRYQRLIEKIKLQLKKEESTNQDPAKVLQETDTTTSEQYKNEECIKTPAATKLRNRKKPSKAEESDNESDHQKFTQPVTLPSTRPPRRAKTAALEKTKMNLACLLNEAKK
ncbi:LOW QUALITY PROTEIN: condensin complex subunit 3 [Microcaecilia unicolor]|uniref:LOW QUALITY PROTEIN: condensin complex subunit 3 n=1 Tax=Microcaecilia unicolor TaxID=1415580 RepID=A0A6P7X943_9AMPH|nr:LOW QUALITY PROTEIN: condensin complex subunit 3 [Microcaecilia unicolor]